MTKPNWKIMVRNFAKEEKGAAMIEYSVLIGLITAAIIATVVTVGAWVGGQWIALDSNLSGEGAPPAT